MRPPTRHERKVLAPSRQRLAMFLTAMLATAQAESPFLRSHEKEFSKKFHKFRGFNGNLQLDKLTPEDMLQLQTRIKASSEELSNLAKTAVGDNAKDMMSAIADTGCSYSALNSSISFSPHPFGACPNR